jgi:hypothetical protein
VTRRLALALEVAKWIAFGTLIAFAVVGVTITLVLVFEAGRVQ